MTGALLLRHAPEIVASTYCSTRLVERADWGSSFGTLPPDVPLDALLERAGIPALS
jgi:putative acyl-CoA dehydrogenase